MRSWQAYPNSAQYCSWLDECKKCLGSKRTIRGANSLARPQRRFLEALDAAEQIQLVSSNPLAIGGDVAADFGALLTLSQYGVEGGPLCNPLYAELGLGAPHIERSQMQILVVIQGDRDQVLEPRIGEHQFPTWLGTATCTMLAGCIPRG